MANSACIEHQNFAAQCICQQSFGSQISLINKISNQMNAVIFGAPHKVIRDEKCIGKCGNIFLDFSPVDLTIGSLYSFECYLYHEDRKRMFHAAVLRHHKRFGTK